jgi:predicted dinucleotide-binding enzyme
MSAVTVVGKGNMGSAIAGLAEKAGRSVETLDSSDTTKPVTGDIVVLAVPYSALSEIAAERADQLAGKVVVDITNPVDFATFDSLVVPPDSSATAELAAALPDAKVLKAFNTTFAATLASGTVGGQPTTVLVAGDDADAKAQLVELVNAAGLKGVDAGSLRRARELEALAFLEMTLAAAGRLSWTGGVVLEDSAAPA